MSHRIALDNYSYRAQYDAAAGPFLAEFRGVSRFRPSARRWAACVLVAAFVLMLGAGTASAAALVSNIGQTATTSASGLQHFDQAQGFTTGSNTAGYTLESIEVKFSAAPSGVSVKLMTGVSTSGAGTEVATLTNPATLSSGNLTFTAPANTTLSAGTTYFVVVEGSGGSLSLTNSNAEDTGAAAGWSVGDGSFHRIASQTGAWNSASGGQSRLIRVNGALKSGGGTPPTPSTPPTPDTTAPQLTRATVSGDRLRLTFSEGLDGSSVPAPAAFDVSVDGTSGAPAAVGVSGRTVTLTLAEAVEPGAVVTVSYTPGGNPLRDAAGNEVAAFSGRPVSHGAPEAVKRIFERALAAVASRTVAGALDNIGARLGDGAPASGMNLAGLTLAGRPAPSDGEGAGGSGAAGFDGHGPDDAWPSGGGSRGMAAGELLGSGAFSLALGAAPGDKEGGKEGEPGFDPTAPRWGIWGRGDYGSFAGRPGEGSRYTGAARTAWFGADARETSGRWVAGLAVSSGTSETDYDLEGETGRLETDLIALWPYGRWTFANGLELRGLAGAGSGTVRYFPEGDAPLERSRLTMRAASLGVRRAFPPLGGFGHGIDLAARADASLARMQTDRGADDEAVEEAVDGLRADVWRLRSGVEASRRFQPRDGVAVTPFTELAARRDGGDGPAGTGIELAGGVRVAAPGVSVEARGRWLAAHSANGVRERGASLTARLGPGAHGRGLSMSFAPRWGAPAGGSGVLWREELPRGAAALREAGGFEGELGYGFGLDGGRFTGTPNVGFGASDGGGRDYRVGWRLTPAGGGSGFEVSLDATRSEAANGNDPAHGAMLTGAMRW